ncbi:hypothetical protein BO94DRAFT_132488 [Aspergillus sclerotioniger CBS 115572]|uniref:Uncharacterized protein n=1 Tax=Aspergillus sclerotioniger CBS 115572 TaxID=1450535 RepID=A0A317XB74_9EURO|nr:hypothetical protein BO94DRAFT_132488 [Aspergillus sclerotioniger CBS 115572]PWY95655.1 hypothetical protein BO94DRAFT_132488 [Aspergillus sclerotioniger CBS 115572]
MDHSWSHYMFHSMEVILDLSSRSSRSAVSQVGSSRIHKIANLADFHRANNPGTQNRNSAFAPGNLDPTFPKPMHTCPLIRYTCCFGSGIKSPKFGPRLDKSARCHTPRHAKAVILYPPIVLMQRPSAITTIVKHWGPVMLLFMLVFQLLRPPDNT